MAFSHIVNRNDIPDGLYLRTMRDIDPSVAREIFKVELILEGNPISFMEMASPSVLQLSSEYGTAEICIPEPNVIRIRGQGVGVRLTFMALSYFEHAVQYDYRWIINARVFKTNFSIFPLFGECYVDAPWQTRGSERIIIDCFPNTEENIFECALEEFTTIPSEPDVSVSFEDCVGVIEQEFGSWLDTTPVVPEEYEETRQLAAYVNWSSVVAPHGALTRPGMYMSKQFMVRIWSWDHCFNALALIDRNPALAWDQFMLPFDYQDPSGLLPDSMSDEKFVYNFCKPPIHGWMLKKLMDRSEFIDNERLNEIYEPLARWTAWWFDYRDSDGDGIPQYHHGNDSGWDNATQFDIGVPLESPDLSAFLVLQMETLSEIANRLGRSDEGQVWYQESQTLLARLIDHSWNGTTFTSMLSGDHILTTPESDSLLSYIPIILGTRLPDDIRAIMLEGLLSPGRFVTDFGIATESIQSPLYEPDGYWRGPIWAPSTMIIIDGLAASGEIDHAAGLARKFCDTVRASGFAENFDATSGYALRDRPYTWTSSVFLILASDYLKPDNSKMDSYNPDDFTMQE